MKRTYLALFFFTCATLALAHGGVQNPAVMARMNLMVDVAAATKTLGDMAKGVKPFDPALAAQARSDLITAADQVQARFEAREGDPKSEARAEIWTDWAGFLARNEAMRAAALALDPATLGSLRSGMGAVGQSCSGCHQDYRVEK